MQLSLSYDTLRSLWRGWQVYLGVGQGTVRGAMLRRATGEESTTFDTDDGGFLEASPPGAADVEGGAFKYAWHVAGEHIELWMYITVCGAADLHVDDLCQGWEIACVGRLRKA